MNEVVTETSPAQCELYRKLKTARMTEQSANNTGSHRLLLEMLSLRGCLARPGLMSQFSKHFRHLKNIGQHWKT